MILTRKATSATASSGRLSCHATAYLGNTIDRRTFLRRYGLAVGGKPAGEYLPPSAHRLFYLCGRVSANRSRPGIAPASRSAHPLSTAARNRLATWNGFLRLLRQRAR